METTGGIPGGPGFETVTMAVAGKIRRPAAMVAVSFVGETNVVLNGAPSHCTIEELTKPVPVRESVKVASPTFADTGVMLVITGGAGVMFKVAATEG